MAYIRQLSSLLFLSQLIFITEVYALECRKPGKMRFYQNNKLKIVNKDFCFNSNNNFIISYQCYFNRNCEAWKKRKTKLKNKLKNSYSSRVEHKLCLLFGGDPKMMEYHNGNNWIETSFCEFADNSFLEMNTWFRRIENLKD